MTGTIACPKCGGENPDYGTPAHMCRKCGWTWRGNFGMDHLELATRVVRGVELPKEVADAMETARNTVEPSNKRRKK